MSSTLICRSGSGVRVLALTLGDANGIGPETAVRGACAGRWPRNWRRVLVGARATADRACRLCGQPPLPAFEPDRPAPAGASLWDPFGAPVPFNPGRVTAGAARAAVRWIEAAVEGCLTGVFDGLVTAPICKEGLHRADIQFPGHTEMLADLTGTRRYAMMLAGGGLRVTLATRHVALSRVAAVLTRGAIEEAAGLTWEALPWLGFPHGRLAICALNPHAGDGGLLGGEERRVIAPAIRALRRRGVAADGPVPADVVFYRALRGEYAAVVAMYHDQGLGPLKMLAFDSGVNVTLGLPIVRTSPDHGTAFDRAWKGTADPGSMRAAIRLAFELAGRPNPWRARARGAA